MPKHTSRRIAPSSGYIGFGNKTSSFSRTARKGFENIPDEFKKTKKRKEQKRKLPDVKVLEHQKSAMRTRIGLKFAKENRRFKMRLIAFFLMCIVLIISLLYILTN